MEPRVSSIIGFFLSQRWISAETANSQPRFEPRVSFLAACRINSAARHRSIKFRAISSGSLALQIPEPEADQKIRESSEALSSRHSPLHFLSPFLFRLRAARDSRGFREISREQFLFSPPSLSLSPFFPLLLSTALCPAEFDLKGISPLRIRPSNQLAGGLYRKNSSGNSIRRRRAQFCSYTAL